MKVRALRGVCAGVGQYLKAGDVVDLDPGTASFLVNLGKAEYVTEAPAASPPVAPVSKKSEAPAEEEPQIDDEPPTAPRHRRKPSK
jgi:hypothetical protein